MSKGFGFNSTASSSVSQGDLMKRRRQRLEEIGSRQRDKRDAMAKRRR